MRFGRALARATTVLPTKKPTRPTVTNISNFLYQTPDGLNLDNNIKFTKGLDENPRLSEYVSAIDAGVKDPFISNRLDKDEVTAIFNSSQANEVRLKSLYSQVDGLKKARVIKDDIEVLGGVGETRGVESYVKDSFRSAEISYKNLYPVFETNLRKGVISRVIKTNPELETQAAQAFDTLVSNPKRFEEVYEINADDIYTSFLGEESPLVNQNPIFKAIKDSFEEYDNEIIKYAQESGVAVGQLENFILPFQIPKLAPRGLGYQRLTDLFKSTTHMTDPQIKNAVDSLIKWSDSTARSTNMAFGMRNIKFKNGLSELNFYREVNQMAPDAPLLALAMQHKQRLLKRSMIMAKWGDNPAQTFQYAANSLGKGKDKVTSKNISQMVKRFEYLMDAYDGKINLTSETVEQFRKVFSQATSIATGASGVSFVRSLVTDFNANLAATGQAVYNPKYGVGSAALGIVTDLFQVIKRAAGSTREKKFMKELLNNLGFANSADGFSHHGMLRFEDLYDLPDDLNKTSGFLAGTVDFLTRTNNTIYTYSGHHALTDQRRVRHLMSAQNHWRNLLKTYDYKTWADSLDSVGKNQLEYLKTNVGIGEAEYNFLGKAKTYTLENTYPVEILSRESILDTPNAVATKFKKPTETVGEFKIRVANSWQQLAYLTMQDATPHTVAVDSLTPWFSGVNSWTRLIISPFLKFTDIAHSQWSNVVDRIALDTYGNKNQSFGFDRSLIKYARATSVYTGSSVGVIWAHDLLRGRKPTDMTNPDNTIKALAGSGFFGASAQLTTSMLNLYDQDSVFKTLPISRPARSIEKLVRTANKDPDLFAYQLGEEIRANSGIANFWYTRGIIEKMWAGMLLSPRQQRKITRETDKWRDRRDKQSRKKWEKRLEKVGIE